MKKCGKCKEEKALDAFHRRRNGRQTWCRECRKSYDAAYHQASYPRRRQQKAEYKREFRAWAASLKTNPCTDCRRQFPPEAMQWDHRPGETKIAAIRDMVSRGFGRQSILDEISKCDLLCGVCHAIRTSERRLGEQPNIGSLTHEQLVLFAS